MAEVDEEHETEDDKYQGDDSCQEALVRQAGLLLHNLRLLKLRVVDGSQFESVVLAFPDDS